MFSEAEPYLIFNFQFTIFNLHTAIRFTVPCKVKVIAVKVSVQHLHILISSGLFPIRLQKYNFFLDYANILKEKSSQALHFSTFPTYLLLFFLVDFFLFDVLRCEVLRRTFLRFFNEERLPWRLATCLRTAGMVSLFQVTDS